MKKNTGYPDWVTRLLFAAVLPGNGIVFGWTWAMVLAVVLAVTALAGRCLVYQLPGLSIAGYFRPQGNTN